MTRFPWCLLALSLLACGDGTKDKAGKAGKAGELATDCETSTDCSEALACLSIGGGQGSCSLICTASADECGAEATCAGVGSASIDVCQPPESVADENNPPSEEERPTLPCKTDDDCEILQEGLVCGTWRATKECTLPCDTDDQCNPPPFGGMTISFLECGADEGEDRTICIPNEDCLNDPTQCVDFGF